MIRFVVFVLLCATGAGLITVLASGGADKRARVAADPVVDAEAPRVRITSWILPEGARVQGDCNHNGRFDTGDMVGVRACMGRVVASDSDSCWEADANGDGLVDTSDYVTLQARMAR